MLDIQAAFDRYKRGDHITDEELIALIEVASAALQLLSLSPRFGLMLIEAQAMVRELEGFAAARKYRG